MRRKRKSKIAKRIIKKLGRVSKSKKIVRRIKKTLG